MIKRRHGINSPGLILISIIGTLTIYCIYTLFWFHGNNDSVTVILRNQTNSCKKDVFEKAISIPSDVQSTWSCSGNMNYETGWQVRTCEFRNICYNKQTGIFQFYRAPGTIKQPILFEPKQGHIYEFNMNNHGFVNLLARSPDDGSWGPTIVEELLPSSNEIPYLEPVHVLFMHWPVPFNPGYVIWEDIATTYISMARLGKYDPQAVLLEYRNYPRDEPHFYKMYQNLVPAFAAKVDGLEHYMETFNSSIVCFRSVVAGGGTTMFSLSNEKYSHGKERHLFEYRSTILKYYNIDLMHPPTEHRIVLVNKTQTCGRGHLRAIKNLDEVEKFIRLTYSSVKLEVVDWCNMSFAQQLQKIYETTVLITPCGGVSSIIPFLPKRAYAIIMDYYVNKEAHLPHEYYQIGESGSMDGAMWNYFPHIHKLYYQVRSEEDFAFDFPNASNSRHDASIIIKMPRLKELIDTALDVSNSSVA